MSPNWHWQMKAIKMFISFQSVCVWGRESLPCGTRVNMAKAAEMQMKCHFSASWLHRSLFLPRFCKRLPSLPPMETCQCHSGRSSIHTDSDTARSAPLSLLSPFRETPSCCEAKFQWHLIRDFSPLKSKSRGNKQKRLWACEQPLVNQSA